MSKIYYAVLALVIASFFYVFLMVFFGYLYLFIENGNYKISNNHALYQNIDKDKINYSIAKEFIYTAANKAFERFKWLQKFENSLIEIEQSDEIIVLVHGFNRTYSDFAWFKNELKKHTDKPIYSVNLVPKFAHIEKIAMNLADSIHKIQIKTNCKKINIISHSMGGLVSGYYAENFDKTNLINKIITIGTPFNGTKVAVVSNAPNAIDMRPDSKFLVELTPKILNSEKSYYNIAVKSDHMIFPWTSSLMDIAESNKYINYSAGHLGALYSKETIDLVLKIIN